MVDIFFKGITQNGEWVYNKSIVYDKWNDCYHMGGMGLLRKVEHICPFIGFKDCNDKEIFEGDIFIIKGAEDIKRRIEYEPEGARFVTVRMEDWDGQERKGLVEHPDREWWDDFRKDIEVIGNIYDKK